MSTFKHPHRDGRRVPFTQEEDIHLLQGILKYGTRWSEIAKNTQFGFVDSRTAEQLRWRFRNLAPNTHTLLYNSGSDAEVISVIQLKLENHLKYLETYEELPTDLRKDIHLNNQEILSPEIKKSPLNFKNGHFNSSSKRNIQNESDEESKEFELNEEHFSEGSENFDYLTEKLIIRKSKTIYEENDSELGYESISSENYDNFRSRSRKDSHNAKVMVSGSPFKSNAISQRGSNNLSPTKFNLNPMTKSVSQGQTPSKRNSSNHRKVMRSSPPVQSSHKKSKNTEETESKSMSPIEKSTPKRGKTMRSNSKIVRTDKA